MNVNNYPRGSEWRKWDLHFHTPSSYDYQDSSVTNEKILEVLKDRNISLVAITDHHNIDIKRIIELQNLAGNEVKILPGIEFCSDSRGKEPIHFIGIFPDVSKDDLIYIKKQILVIANIDEKKQRGKKENEIYCNLKITTELIRKLGGLVTIHAGKKTNSIENITNSLPYAMAQKEEILENIDIFELGKEEDQESYEKIVFKKIKTYPMVICSDNHNINNYSLKQNCWIKADPTFEGLKQIIYEPDERTCIKEQPDLFQRVKENKTKFIKSLEINQVAEYSENKGIWFKNITIPINSGMVAIIGNKGSGKSALTDILSLCGNSHRYNDHDFSFLTHSRFLKEGLAKNFKAKLVWENNETIERNLSEGINQNAPERVRYLPQNYFEKLTNDLEYYKFEETLENIVFNHLPNIQKLGKKSFKELINYKKDNLREEIKIIFKDIEKLNERIIELDAKKHPNYKQKLDYSLNLKKQELKEHEKIKPTQALDPSEDESLSSEQKNITKELKSLNKKLLILEKEIKKKTKDKEKYNIKKEKLEKIKKDTENIEFQINRYLNENRESCKKLNLSITDILKYRINFNIIETEINKNENEMRKLDNLLIEPDEIEEVEDLTRKEELKKSGLVFKKAELLDKIKEVKKILSEPQKEYQKYVEDFRKWKITKQTILGNADTTNSIKWYEEEIKFVTDELEKEIKNLRNRQIKKSLEIYSLKKEMVDLYNNFKKSIDIEINKYKKNLGDYDINIEANLKIDQKFNDNLLSYINKNKKGTFYGIDEGKNILKKIIENTNFNKKQDMEKFLNKIIEFLNFDQRDDFKDNKRYIYDQIDEKKLLEFYNYLFSLKYVNPTYELKLSNKKISLLSPGEKGALLIMFYLLLDKDNIPLIIDQPEENLDNESIFKILTYFIKETKKKRQLIIATHNPNLAIVGDAEQIIYVGIDKKNYNKFRFESGAIENPNINKHASDILEGTIKAFDIRRLKYFQRK